MTNRRYGLTNICLITAQVPPEIISSGEILLVRFKTDDSINAKGFSASYQKVPEQPPDAKIIKPHTEDKVIIDHGVNEVRKDGSGSDLNWRFEYFGHD